MTELKYLTVTQAAKILKVNPVTVRRMMKAGQIATIRIGSRLFVPEVAIAEYVERNTKPAVA